MGFKILKGDLVTGDDVVGRTPILRGKYKITTVIDGIQFVYVETGEKDENLFGANGQNDWEKGLGSALTYAERYFLLKFFHIATDEDDIDNPNRKPEQKPTPKKKVELKQGSKEWNGALEYLKKGGNISDITKKYSISDSNREELMNKAI